MNNNDLVDIVYSKTIDNYVIILKRFPDMPVIVSYPSDIKDLIDLIYNRVTNIYIYDHIVSDNISEYNGLELLKKDNSSYIYCATCDDGDIMYQEKISDLERNEIINKLLEIYEVKL